MECPNHPPRPHHCTIKFVLQSYPWSHPPWQHATLPTHLQHLLLTLIHWQGSPRCIKYFIHVLYVHILPIKTIIMRPVHFCICLGYGVLSLIPSQPSAAHVIPLMNTGGHDGNTHSPNIQRFNKPEDPSEQQGQQFSKTSVRSDELIMSVVSRPSEISQRNLISEHDSICQLKKRT